MGHLPYAAPILFDVDDICTFVYNVGSVQSMAVQSSCFSLFSASSS